MTISLSPLNRTYLADIYENNRDNVKQYFFDFQTLSDAASWLRKAFEEIEAGRRVEFVIQKDGAFAGMIGGTFPSNDTCEVMIWLSPDAQQQGIGMAAIKKFLQETDFSNYIYRTDQDNLPSQKLALKSGFDLQTNRDHEGLRVYGYTNK
jgi:RimJ/RimL family protein N-acetyltransferase